MTVRIERTFDVPASRERVWEFLSDPENRARAISVVDSYEVTDAENNRARWNVRLPIPFVRTTVPVETEDVTRRPPEYVKFVGESSALRVTGEHELTAIDDGCRLDNRFVVDGKIPGVETFFKRNFDDELENLQHALERDISEQS